MTATIEAPKKFLPASEIVARAKSGEGGLIVWSIDAAYPAERVDEEHPRVGRFNAMYTLEDGTWCSISHKNAKAKNLATLLQLEDPTVEWATAYDGAPSDDDERPFGIGPEGKENLMAYRGRVWYFASQGFNDPYDDGIECEICDFSTNDVGSCCYYEKKNGVYEMVIG